MFTENSSDLEEQREDYMNELIALHATVKRLDRHMDFSAILDPMLAETGPAMTHVPKLARQIASMKKFVEQTLDEDNWINCACSVHPARCFRKYGCIQGMAEVPGTIAMHVSNSGHWNGISDFPETIPGDPGPPRRLHAKTRSATEGLQRRTGAGISVRRSKMH